MRRAGILVCLLLAVGSTAASAAARSPRLEHLALTPADNRIAAGAQVRKSDLTGIPPGWLPLSTTPDNSAPVCSWQNYAPYTLTGRAEADFQPTKVGHAGFVGSSIDILATRRRNRKIHGGHASGNRRLRGRSPQEGLR